MQTQLPPPKPETYCNGNWTTIYESDAKYVSNTKLKIYYASTLALATEFHIGVTPVAYEIEPLLT